MAPEVSNDLVEGDTVLAGLGAPHDVVMELLEAGAGHSTILPVWPVGPARSDVIFSCISPRGESMFILCAITVEAGLIK